MLSFARKPPDGDTVFNRGVWRAATAS
jgi:hypothetical protein